MSQMNPIHILTPHTLSPIVILSFHLRLGLSIGLSPSGFLAKILSAVVISLMRVVCSANLILYRFIILITFGDEYKLWGSSLCNIVKFLLISPSLSPTPCSPKSSAYVLRLELEFHIHTKTHLELLPYI